MKAVNLIPDEQRRGAGGTTGRSGGVAYAVIGVLAGIVALFAVYTMSTSTIKTRQSELDSLKQQVIDSQTANAQLQRYAALAQERKERVATVTQIADTRFDWAHALREIPRVLPKDVWLESMAGTVTPTSTAGAAGSTTANEPAIEIQGCTTSQGELATVMADLQSIDHVDTVELTKSAKADSPSTSAGSCTVTSQYPAFDVTVSFTAPGATTNGSGTDTTVPATNSPSTSVGSTPTVTPTPATPVSNGTAGAAG